jgi:ATP-binding cassette subfamily F protein 3
MALVGDNGAGKSTLLKLMAGALAPSSGLARRAPAARVATFAQHAVDGLDMAKTPLGAAAAAAPSLDEPAARAHLARFSIDATLASRRLYTLSGGQRVRVALAIATIHAPHLLLLDEPTNHLDMETIDALVDAVRAFEGAVVVVSHDAHLLAAACPDALYEVGGGRITRFGGSFAEYRAALRARVATATGGK